VFVAAITITNTLLGVYSRHRTYPMPTKLMRLLQSAAIAGAVAGVAFFLLSPAFEVPLTAFLGAWVLTAMALPAARWWTWAYRMDVQARQVQEDKVQRALSLAANGHDRGQGHGTVLVVGGAGYIGSALLPRLLESGRRVRLLDVFLYGKEPVKRWLDHPNLEVVEADYRKFDKLVEAMQGVETVVHLGGLVGDPACAWNEALTVEVNLTFTRVIAEIAKASGVGHFVFASTCSVYGASDEILDEDSELHPVSLYARSKIGSERVLKQLHGPGFQVTLLRFDTIYGISGRTRFDLVVNLLTAKAHVDRGITVFGGDQWRPFVHVADAAKAVAMVLEAPRELVAGRVYNVGSDEQNATLGQVGHLINRLVPEAEYVDSGRDGDRRNYRVSFRRIREELGFHPEWTLEAGVNQVLDALKSGRVTDYRDPQYSNIRYLTEMTDAVYRTTETDFARGLISDSEVIEPLLPAERERREDREVVGLVTTPDPFPRPLASVEAKPARALTPLELRN
jgi:nucleoside-diphosphate-sugar epimerase